MSKSVLYMSMSLDGFITGPEDGAGQGLGVGGHRLHDWLGDVRGGASGYRPEGPSGGIFDEVLATGAVVVGLRCPRFDGVGGAVTSEARAMVLTSPRRFEARTFPLPELGPEVVEIVLTPYVGAEAARGAASE